MIRGLYPSVANLSREKAARYIWERTEKAKLGVKLTTIKAYLSDMKDNTLELMGNAVDTAEELQQNLDEFIGLSKATTEKGIQVERLVRMLIAQNDALTAVRTKYEALRLDYENSKAEVAAWKQEVARMKKLLGDIGKRLLKNGEVGTQQ